MSRNARLVASAPKHARSLGPLNSRNHVAAVKYVITNTRPGKRCSNENSHTHRCNTCACSSKPACIHALAIIYVSHLPGLEKVDLRANAPVAAGGDLLYKKEPARRQAHAYSSEIFKLILLIYEGGKKGKYPRAKPLRAHACVSVLYTVAAGTGKRLVC